MKIHVVQQTSLSVIQWPTNCFVAVNNSAEVDMINHYAESNHFV